MGAFVTSAIESPRCAEKYLTRAPWGPRWAHVPECSRGSWRLQAAQVHHLKEVLTQEHGLHGSLAVDE